jgi:DNA polymerase II large subunit
MSLHPLIERTYVLHDEFQRAVQCASCGNRFKAAKLKRRCLRQGKKLLLVVLNCDDGAVQVATSGLLAKIISGSRN